MKIANFVAPSIPIEPDNTNQAPSNIGNQSITPDSATMSPTSSNKSSADTARENLVEAAVANKANLPTVNRAPLDDPLSKALLLDRLGCGNNPQPHPYNVLMENTKVDDTDETDDTDNTGTDFPAEDSGICIDRSMDRSVNSSSTDNSSTDNSANSCTEGRTDSLPAVTHPEQQTTNYSGEDVDVTPHEQTSGTPDTTSETDQTGTKVDSSQTASKELGVCTEDGDLPADPRDSVPTDPVKLLSEIQHQPADDAPQLSADNRSTDQKIEQQKAVEEAEQEAEQDAERLRQWLDMSDELGKHTEKELPDRALPAPRIPREVDFLP